LTKPDRIILRDISIVIPVKDNQSGIDDFLGAFFESQEPANYPFEIIIIDNESRVPIIIPDKFLERDLEIKLYRCLKPGPAAARNLGASHASGQWLLFVDSDCIPTKTTISGYVQVSDEAIGYQGYVGALGEDVVSRYYESQQIHQPPTIVNGDGVLVPKYLVTANILVWREAFDSIEGFDESYVFAGEDIDFGSRLSQVGRLSYAPSSVVLHNFDDGFPGLVRRFIAYGKGNRVVQQRLKISLYPFPFTAKNKRVLINHLLAIVQWLCLLTGFTLKSVELLIKGKHSDNVYEDQKVNVP
jgi:glycosyltransferase involved in cell wall biosynthesis